MNYHIMIDEKFLPGFIDDITTLQLLENNQFYVRCSEKDGKYLKPYHVNWLKSNNEIADLLLKITSADKIFIHWFDLFIGELCLNIKKSIPIYVFLWGGDFYNDPDVFKPNEMYDKLTLKQIKNHSNILRQKGATIFDNIKHFIKHQIENYFVSRQMIRKIKTVQRVNFLVAHPDNHVEYELIKKIFKATNMKFIGGFYNHNISFAKNENLNLTQNTSYSHRVLVGNSAVETNNHLDCFDAIKKQLREPAEIICPLSYGDEWYKQLILQSGKEYFEKDFIPITELMPRDSYINFLASIDVAIFYHNRSQAYGNIAALIAMGKKVYIKKRNPIFSYLTNFGVTIFDAEELNFRYTSFFEPLTISQQTKNFDIINSLSSDEERLICLRSLLS